MKFKSGTRRKAIEYEKDLLKFWAKEDTFRKSIEQRSADNAYVFYDGPPFITGVPHTGTLLSSISKDVVPRYQTMKGMRVERVWGWDCHGLPAEVFTERKLGIKDHNDIGTKISLEKYITTCRDNMVQTGSLWEDTIARVGRWVDFKGAYRTMDKDYMESVWWAFKQLYDKGKIYEGEKVLLYCTRDATPISKAEVAMDNSYQDDTEPSVFVKFKLLSSPTSTKASEAEPKKPDTYLLAWTTTPWTLPANTAVAVNKDFDYTALEVNGEVLILASDLVGKVMTDDKHRPLEYRVLEKFKGSKLVGRAYEPLFENRGHNAHQVWHADYVSLEEGTGVVHLAPAYGEEDFTLAKAKDFPIVSNIDDSGVYTSGQWKGEYVWDINKQVAKTLLERGVVWKIEYITHSYPHCHRCGTKLMYRAHPSWFMDIDGQRGLMLEKGGQINWFPPHIGEGRWPNTIESAPDWNLSRDRFWATAMPVWKSDKGDIKVIGSYEELKELSGVELEDYHRPWIDDVTFTIGGAKYQRIDKVMDCWFESGSMPFAQFHYPFENVEKFERNFPGDFVVEYVGQVRAWFYYLHAVNVGLFGEKAFKNVIVTGTLAGNDGRKMSKSFSNYTDPTELMDTYSADALRFLLMASPLLSGEDFDLSDKDVADVNRKLAMVGNMYDFFTMYAEVDGWEYDGLLDDPLTDERCSNPLDVWIVSRLHQLIQEVAKHMDKYDIPGAVKPILPFLDDASNWYVRRSRRRFWRESTVSSSKASAANEASGEKGKNQDDTDKQMAYQTLHYILTRLMQIMAPFTPFLAEEYYRKLTGRESVHLEDWPAAGHVDQLAIDAMDVVKKVVNEGLAKRAKAGVKVRQPLSQVVVAGVANFIVDNRDKYESIILDELNVKTVKWLAGSEFLVDIDTNLTTELSQEGLAREVIRLVQAARKSAGLNVEDRINLSLITADRPLAAAIRGNQELIAAETLATHINETGSEYGFLQPAMVGKAEIKVSLEKS